MEGVHDIFPMTPKEGTGINLEQFSTIQCHPNGIKESFTVKRFGEESHRTGSHRLQAHRLVAVRRHKNDRDRGMIGI